LARWHLLLACTLLGQSTPILHVLLCLFGGALGWVIGIAISPLDAGEKKQFSDWVKAITALISGYVVAKLDTILQSAWSAAAGDHELLVARLLLFGTCFLLTALFTFVGRRYLRGSEEERRLKCEKALGELREALDKLAALARCSRCQVSNSLTSGRLRFLRTRTRSCGVLPLISRSIAIAHPCARPSGSRPASC